MPGSPRGEWRVPGPMGPMRGEELPIRLGPVWGGRCPDIGLPLGVMGHLGPLGLVAPPGHVGPMGLPTHLMTKLWASRAGPSGRSRA